jgi:hypothetical protein
MYLSAKFNESLLDAGSQANEILSGEQAFRALSVFDVGVRSEPFDNLSIVVGRRSLTEKKPTIHAIKTA